MKPKRDEKSIEEKKEPTKAKNTETEDKPLTERAGTREDRTPERNKSE